MSKDEVIEETDSKSKKKKNKKKSRTLLVVILVLAIAAVLAVVFVFGGSLFNFGSQEQNIARMETSTQQMGGITTTNYVPILADRVDWEAISETERANIARYAVNLAITEAEANGVRSYNVLGMTPERKSVFLFSDGSDTIVIYVNDTFEVVPLK